jgi:hypothetical protein
MTMQELQMLVMDDIPGFDDSDRLVRAVNRVIGQVNNVISGIRERITGTTFGSASEADFGWDASQKELSLPNYIKSVEHVIVADGDQDTYLPALAAEQIGKHLGGGYSVPQHGKVRLTADTVTPSGAKLELIVNRLIPKLSDVGGEIGLPGLWDELVVSGVLQSLTISGKWKDEDLYKLNKMIFTQTLHNVNGWEENYYPDPIGDLAYNYNGES